MSNCKFFSNNVVFVDGMQGEKITSLAGSRPNPQTIFDVPEHTVGTPNLLVFVDGNIKLEGTDYSDINSKQVLFANPVAVTSNVFVILIRSETKSSGGGSSTDLEWGRF